LNFQVIMQINLEKHCVVVNCTITIFLLGCRSSDLRLNFHHEFSNNSSIGGEIVAPLLFPYLGARMPAWMSDLAIKTCVPCRGGVPPLKGEELAVLKKQVNGWNVIEEHHITKAFKFPNFREALNFVNRVGELAEEQGHHPDISLAWGKVEIMTWTHKINGLTENDFILAAKIDQLYQA
jgi:4a-hydroxytetrahydrobiopterin dehydratase